METKYEIERQIRRVVEKWMNTEDPKLAKQLETEYDTLTKKLHNL